MILRVYTQQALRSVSPAIANNTRDAQTSVCVSRSLYEQRRYCLAKVYLHTRSILKRHAKKHGYVTPMTLFRSL